MPWNPDIYNRFKAIRFKPFFDLMHLISESHLRNGIDIGCGTGEQTAILSDKFKDVAFTGIDTSDEMLSGSKNLEHEKLHFRIASIEEFVEDGSYWDLIFSNAALQWSNDHRPLFPQLIAKLHHQGQLAVQMPCQHENTLNQILLEMAGEQPFVEMLNGFRRDSPMLSIDEYAAVMFDGGLTDLNIFIKVYPIIAKSELDLYDFISGSALIPYMERLNLKDQILFKAGFIDRIKQHFEPFPAIYPFKRIFLYGVKR